MRNRSKQATSKFHGVSMKEGKWLAQYASAGFYQRYDSEIEAFAHFVRIYSDFMKKKPGWDTFLKANAVWQGRMPIELMSHWTTGKDGKICYRFPIDKLPEHVVKLDYDNYDNYRSKYWFLREGRITTVSAHQRIGEKYHFEYVYLDSLIYARQTKGEYSPAKPQKIDRDEFNLVRSNLVRTTAQDQLLALPVEPLEVAVVVKVAEEEVSEQRQAHEEESWQASSSQSSLEPNDQPCLGDEIYMPR